MAVTNGSASLPEWVTIEFWIVYHLVVAIFIIIDLYSATHREELTFREATLWTIIWIGVGVAWGGVIFWLMGPVEAGLYYAAFLIEKMLSMDNLFVFAIIFSYFSVPENVQPVVLYVGIITAVIFRALFIYGGIVLIEQYQFTVVIFGLILFYSGYKLLKSHEMKVEPEKNPIIRLARKYLPIYEGYEGYKFIVRRNGKIYLTPLVLVLIAIETTDIIFAVDSVPAVLAITTDFLIAYTSNISAVLGLRALYSLVSLTVLHFKYVGKGLSIILTYLGAKMILNGLNIYKIETTVSIAIVMAILLGSIILSVVDRGGGEGGEAEEVAGGEGGGEGGDHKA